MKNFFPKVITYISPRKSSFFFEQDFDANDKQVKLLEFGSNGKLIS
jgi:hypothetical protein